MWLSQSRIMIAFVGEQRLVNSWAGQQGCLCKASKVWFPDLGVHFVINHWAVPFKSSHFSVCFMFHNKYKILPLTHTHTHVHACARVHTHTHSHTDKRSWQRIKNSGPLHTFILFVSSCVLVPDSPQQPGTVSPLNIVTWLDLMTTTKIIATTNL